MLQHIEAYDSIERKVQVKTCLIIFTWDMSHITHFMGGMTYLQNHGDPITTHCNKLQHTATHCISIRQDREATVSRCITFVSQCNTLQHTATHCNTLQHTTAHCNTLQHTATRCSTLQRTATHCNTLQHTATGLMGSATEVPAV